MSDQTCETCKYFFVSATNKDLSKSTVCRRYPPVGQLVPDRSGNVGQIGFFPPTQETFTCGEWAPRNILQVQ